MLTNTPFLRLRIITNGLFDSTVIFRSVLSIQSGRLVVGGRQRVRITQKRLPLDATTSLPLGSIKALQKRRSPDSTVLKNVKADASVTVYYS